MRRGAGNGAFLAALGVSFLLHLSIVTVFEVVLFFPRHDIEYHEFQIVDPRSVSPVEAAVHGARIAPPSPENALTRAAEEGIIGPADQSWPGLPEIELPKLEFAQMDLLRMRSEAIEVRSKYEDLFEKEPDDLWARFGQGVSSLGDTLSRIASGPDGETDARPVSRPAPGFEAYVEWLVPPRDRKPLAVAKVEALWGRGPETLPEPLVLHFQVSREGKVLSVLPGVVANEALVDSASEALIRYRFEPVDASAPESQRGSFIIRAAESRP